ncbi:MAG: hypothetical protein WCA16_00170 [Candidatus Sulfotelmatobacter sp.]
MELSQAYIIDAGWIFFAGWGVVLLAISVAAFGRDLLPSTRRNGDAKQELHRQ